MRFSARLAWDTAENALTRALADRRAAGLPVADLTESNPTRVGIAYPEAEIRAALADAAAAPYRPDARGLRVAREAVAAELGASPDRVLLTASTSEAYAYLFKLLCDPGDAVLVPEPSYPLFGYLAALEGVRTVGYSLEHPMPNQAGARALSVVNPNNPTGAYLARAAWARLDAWCADRDAALIADEVFAAYPSADAPADRVDFVAGAGGRALSFSLGGLSKSCGLPQLKLGWIVAGGPGADDALARLELISDSYLSVATPVQLAAPRLLALGAGIRAAIAARVADNRAFLAERVGGAATLVRAEGGWSAVLRLPRTRAEEDIALALLQNRGVLVHPGYFFDFPGGTHLVVSLLPAPETFRPAALALLEEVG